MAKDEKPLGRRNRALITGGVVAGLLGGGAYLRQDESQEVDPREVAQQKADAEARRRFAAEGATLEEAPNAASAIAPKVRPVATAVPAVPAVLDSCVNQGGRKLSRTDIKHVWEMLRRGGRSADDFEEAELVLQDMKTLMRKHNNTPLKELTEKDFSQFGIKRDEFMAVLGEAAMSRARLSLQQAHQPRITDANAYPFLSDVNLMLSYTNYPDRGTALSALCAMQPECGTPEAFDERLKALAGVALQGYARSYRENGFDKNNFAVSTYDAIYHAVIDSGQNPANDALMRDLVGVTNAELRQRAMERQAVVNRSWSEKVTVEKAEPRGPSCP